MLGIIGAMDVEVDSIEKQMENTTVNTLNGMRFTIGEIYGNVLALARCSPGKVNAAICAQILIDRYGADKIINTGVAGSLSKSVKIKNIVIASDVCQYDIDVTAIGDPAGYINGLNKIKLACNRKMSDTLARAAIDSGEVIHRGTVASGDTFVADSNLKEKINSSFGAICADMEAAPIGQACTVSNIPFAVIRTISDGGDEESFIDYPAFKKIAAAKSTAIILKYIKSQNEQLSF